MSTRTSHMWVIWIELHFVCLLEIILLCIYINEKSICVIVLLLLFRPVILRLVELPPSLLMDYLRCSTLHFKIYGKLFFLFCNKTFSLSTDTIFIKKKKIKNMLTKSTKKKLFVTFFFALIFRKDKTYSEKRYKNTKKKQPKSISNKKRKLSILLIVYTCLSTMFGENTYKISSNLRDYHQKKCSYA